MVDVDTTDENVLADALERHGQTPFLVRSGRGHFQAWYRRQSEGRLVRPDPRWPIDILGRGLLVAPPSLGQHGPYSIIRGTLAELRRLPDLENAPVGRGAHGATIVEGGRNNALWRHCMRQARHCDDFDALLDVARTSNASIAPTRPDDEVVKVARSAWDYTERGQNWIGVGKRVSATFSEIDGLLQDHPDAFILLTILRRHHRDGTFVVANAMAEQMPDGGWSRKRFADARHHLLDVGALELVRPPLKHVGAALYRFRVVDSDHQY